MTDEDMAELLHAFAIEGIYFEPHPRDDRIKSHLAKSTLSHLHGGFRLLLRLHEAEIARYLRAHPDVPRGDPDFDLNAARALVVWLGDEGLQLAEDNGQIVLVAPEPAAYLSLIIVRLQTELRTVLGERATQLRHRRDVSAGLRRTIICFHDFTCQYCQREGEERADPDGNAWHIDHLRPIAFGGTNEPANLILSCQRCNLGKGSKGVEEFMGWKSKE